MVKLKYVFLLFLFLSTLPALAVDISPSETDLCQETTYTISWENSLPPINLTVEIPEGFNYVSNTAEINYSGTKYNKEPSISGNALTWNFVDHVIINEVDLANNKIELFNPTRENVNLSGWSIETSQGSFDISGTISAGGYAIFNVSMRNNNEQVKLYDNGNLVDQTPSLNYQSGKTWQRYPNGKDTDSNDDWQSRDSTLDYSNDGTNKVEVKFNLTTCCNAESGKRINATVYYNNDIESNSKAILVNKPYIVVEVEPDVIAAHLNDTVKFTLTIKNTGSAKVYNVFAKVDLYNLTLVNIMTNSLSWVYDVINESETKTETINVTVSGCSDQYLNFSANWSCCGEVCQEEYAKGSIKFLPRHPDLNIDINDVIVDYCEKEKVRINLSNSGDSIVDDLKLVMDGLPSQYVSNVTNATFYASNNTFVVGDINPGESKVVTFDFGMSYGDCYFPSGSVVIRPFYYDECHKLWKPPITMFGYSFNSSTKPSISITKKANVSTAYVGDYVMFNITAKYSKGNCADSVDAKIVDKYSEYFEVVDSGDGVVDKQNHTITWNVTLNDGEEWKKSIVFKVNISKPCSCGQTLKNNVSIDAGYDCCNCSLQDSASDSIVVECYNRSVETSSKTANPNPQEVCKNVEYNTTYVFSRQLNWSDVWFKEVGNNGQTFPDGSKTGTAYFIINGTTTVSHDITLDEWLNLGFLNGKINPGTQLSIKYTLKQNNPGSFADWSYLNITGHPYGHPYGCAEFYKEAVIVTAESVNLNIAVDVPDVLNACEEYNVTIKLTKIGGTAYNVTVYFNDTYLKYKGPTEMSGFNNESGATISSFEPTRNGNILSWHFGNLTEVGTIKFKAQKNCGLTSKAYAWVDYQDYCDYINCTQQSCDVKHSSDEDEPLITTSGDITICKTPDIIFATQRNFSWNICVVNKGNGTAKNVTVVDVLDSDLKYLSSDIDGNATSPTISGNKITWELGDLKPKERKKIRLNATFKGCENLNNFVYAKWSCCLDGCEECQNVSDKSRVETLEGKLVIVRHDGELIDECGGYANFTIIAKNVGPVYAYDAKIIEKLPNCLVFEDNPQNRKSNPQADRFTYYSNNNTLIWYYDEIPSESEVNINFKVKINDSCICNESLGTAVARTNYTLPCGKYGTEDSKSFDVKKASPHLSIEKTPEIKIANSGETFTWTITITSDGNYKARNITLVDELPSNVDFVSANPSPDKKENNNRTLTWNVPDLDVGEKFVVRLNVSVNSCSDDTQNKATVYWGCCLPQDTESAIATLITKPKIKLDKSIDVNTCGGTIEITIRNNGAKANVVDITEHLSSQGYEYSGGASITSSSGRHFSNPTPSVNGGIIKWTSSNIDAIYPNEQITIKFNVKNVDCNKEYCNITDTISDTVSFNYTDSCYNSYSNQTTKSANVKIIKLDVKKVPKKQLVIPGQKAVWYIKVSSYNDTAPNVTVEDILGSAFHNVEVIPNDATITIENGKTKIVWKNQTIPEENTWVRTVKADVYDNGTLENNVTVKGYCNCGCLYSQAGDLVYTDRLEFTKRPNDTLTIGEYANFTITAHYWGQEEYKNVVVTDNLPVNFKFISANSNPSVPLQINLYNGGKQLVWNIGDFTGPRTYTFNITTIINNTMENQNGVNAVNYAYSTHTNESGQTFQTHDTATVNIVEPNLRIEKQANRSDVEINDVVKYAIKVYHNGSTHDAYDVWINDTIPDKLELLSYSVTPNPDKDVSAGNKISVFYKHVPLSTDSTNPINITYYVRVKGSILINDVFKNNATVTWTSTSGENDYERYGGWNELNDYNDKDEVEVKANRNVGIVKEVDKDKATIGEMLNYTINVYLPKVNLEEVWINDTLPNGVIYDDQFSMIANNETFEETINGQTISWYLGRVNNTDGKNITITFRAIIDNVSSVKNGDVLENNVVFKAKGVQLSAKAGTKVIEPDLIIEKRAVNYALVGDVVNYTLLIYHSSKSSSTAYDVSLIDTFPDHTTYVPNSAKIVSGSGTLTVENGRLRATFESIDLSWDSNNPIKIDYKLQMQLSPTRNWTNYAYLNWSSLPKEQPHERNYTNKTKHEIIDAQLNLTKIDNPDPVIAGKLLNYTITVKNDGRENITNITVKEYYDPNVTFVSANPMPDKDNDTWYYDLLKPGENFDIKITVRVKKVENGTILINEVKLTSDQVSDETRENTTVLAPILKIEKIDDPDPIFPGRLLNYTITVTNVGIVNATDLVVKEYYDPNVTFVSANPMPDKDNDTWYYDLLKPGESFDIKITVRVNETLPHGTIIKNVCSVESNETEPIYAYENTTVSRLPILKIKKTGTKVVDPYGVITYEIEYCVENGKAYGVKIIEYYPSRTQFITATPMPTNGNNVWEIGDMEPGTCGKIIVKIRVLQYEYEYHSESSVEGKGLVIVNKEINTGQEEYYVTNKVKMTAEPVTIANETYYIKPAVATFTTKVRSEAGTKLSLHEHGSGDYYTNENISAIKRKGLHQVQINKDVLAKLKDVNTTVFDFNVTAPWKVDICLKNYIRNESIHQAVEGASYVEESINGTANEATTSISYNQSVYGWSKLGVKSKHVNIEGTYVGRLNISRVVGFK